jgi:colanic acid/amylovoran biosynthesis glycosyltransferase
VTADGNRESGLMVVKEASATGVVPIGTYHGGIPEIIEDGRTGFLVPERDVEALAERLGWLVADAELRRRMGEAARAKMEREYDNTQRVAVLEALYDEARELAEASPRP